MIVKLDLSCSRAERHGQETETATAFRLGNRPGYAAAETGPEIEIGMLSRRRPSAP